MNKKILMLCLTAGVLFTGCEKDSVSENLTSEQQLQLTEKGNSTDLNSKIHEPPLTVEIHTPDWTIAIHTPDWTRADYPTCGDLPTYDKKNLIWPSSKEKEMFGGENYVKKASIASDVFFCGALAIEKSANILWGGVLSMTGDMLVGTTEEPQDLTITRGGHLEMHGKLHVTGNLILKEGATMVFEPCNDVEGENHNMLIVDGEIIIEGEDTMIEGDYTDHSDHDHTH